MRLFVAITVGDEVRAAAASVRRALEHQLSRLPGEPPRIVWVAPAALHVTLRFLGEQPDEQVPGLVEAVQEPYGLAPFDIVWRGVGTFPSPRRPRALWVGVGEGARELGVLESELARRLGRLLPGERPDAAAPFHPHLTLGRVKTDHAAADWRAMLEATPVAGVRTRVDRVSLIRSRGLAGGAGYEEIGAGLLAGTR